MLKKQDLTIAVSKISAFTEIPSSLEYIDEYGLLLEERQILKEGYIYDYDKKNLI